MSTLNLVFQSKHTHTHTRHFTGLKLNTRRDVPPKALNDFHNNEMPSRRIATTVTIKLH